MVSVDLVCLSSLAVRTAVEQEGQCPGAFPFRLPGETMMLLPRRGEAGPCACWRDVSLRLRTACLERITVGAVERNQHQLSGSNQQKTILPPFGGQEPHMEATGRVCSLRPRLLDLQGL